MDNLRLSEMLAKGEITETGELTDEQREFLTLHGNICRKGAQVVVSMVDFASELKEMRDKKLYANAGYESFGAYCERAVGLKESMAYRYVKVYEELPRDFLYSNTKIGITKLSMLARLSDEAREEVIKAVDVESTTVDGLKKVIDEREKRIKELEIDLIREAKKNAQADEVDKAKSAAEKKLTETLKERDRLKKALDDLKSLPREVEKVDNPETAAKLTRLEKVVADKDEEIRRLTNKIKIVSDEELTKFKVKFEELQILLNDMKNLTLAMSEENCAKCKGALKSVLGVYVA